jgi:hypothetical protein
MSHNRRYDQSCPGEVALRRHLLKRFTLLFPTKMSNAAFVGLKGHGFYFMDLHGVRIEPQSRFSTVRIKLVKTLAKDMNHRV